MIDDIPDWARVRVLTLFRAANYCFATTTPDRSPTFYFAQGGPAALQSAPVQGRLRTCHPHGPLIEVTAGQRRHLFYPVAEADAFETDWTEAIMPAKRRYWTNGLDRDDLFARVSAIIAERATAPVEGALHMEVWLAAPVETRPVEGYHPSGGRIALQPGVQTDAQARAILSQLLTERAPVEIDGAVVPMPASQRPAVPARRPTPALAAYLGRLPLA